MNMLTNKIPFGLLDEEDQKMFKNAGRINVEFYDSLKGWQLISKYKMDWCDRSNAVRLKLKDGEWYNVKCNNYSGNHEGIFKCSKAKDGLKPIFHKYRPDGDIYEVKVGEERISFIRPATQQEIASVQPEFKRGDVVISPIHKTICRIGFSIFHPVLCEINISSNCANNVKNPKKPTHEQIKQLEYQEMLHGKKYNAEKEDYDDFLTYDGLALEELLEHDLSEIEFNYSGRAMPRWKETENTKAQLSKCVLNNETIHLYRLKPVPSFVDVGIGWDKDCIAPIIIDGTIVDNLFDFAIGKPIKGWVLSGYMFNPQSDTSIPFDKPVKFDFTGKTIEEKATHARFVRIEL